HLVRDPEVGGELLVGPVERRIRNIVPVEDAAGAAIDDPGRTVRMARLEDPDALKRRGGGGCRCGHGSFLYLIRPSATGMSGGKPPWVRGGVPKARGCGSETVQGPRFAPRTVEAERKRAQLLHHSHSAISMSLERT